MAVVVSLFVLVIGLGFEINEGSPPLGTVSSPAGGALLVSLGPWSGISTATGPTPIGAHPSSA
ncbi:MAG: hypothetical protein ACOVO5_01110, partial [Devosia sp.]